jgi:hypothetical protein
MQADRRREIGVDRAARSAPLFSAASIPFTVNQVSILSIEASNPTTMS